jgi:hypothetical protein
MAARALALSVVAGTAAVVAYVHWSQLEDKKVRRVPRARAASRIAHTLSPAQNMRRLVRTERERDAARRREEDASHKQAEQQAAPPPPPQSARP